MGDTVGRLFLTNNLKALSRNTFGKLLSSIIQEIMNKKATVVDLRKSYVSHVFKNAIPLKDRIDLSKRMLHSVETAQLTYEKKN